MMRMVKWPKLLPKCQVMSCSEAAGRILLKEILWGMHETLHNNKDKGGGEGRRERNAQLNVSVS